MYFPDGLTTTAANKFIFKASVINPLAVTSYCLKIYIVKYYDNEVLKKMEMTSGCFTTSLQEIDTTLNLNLGWGVRVH